jgi:DNA-directed RNA polymerase specialized sigma24 family protein
MTRDLVVHARKGDHDAFAVLAGAAISRLSSTAWLMLRDRDRASDAVQNALVRAWRDLPRCAIPIGLTPGSSTLVNAVRRSRRLAAGRLGSNVTRLTEIMPFHA